MISDSMIVVVNGMEVTVKYDQTQEVPEPWSPATSDILTPEGYNQRPAQFFPADFVAELNATEAEPTADPAVPVLSCCEGEHKCDGDEPHWRVIAIGTLETMLQCTIFNDFRHMGRRPWGGELGLCPLRKKLINKELKNKESFEQEFREITVDISWRFTEISREYKINQALKAVYDLQYAFRFNCVVFPENYWPTYNALTILLMELDPLGTSSNPHIIIRMFSR